jgi:branched-chain amino acid transport system substrate-binding protein
MFRHSATYRFVALAIAIHFCPLQTLTALNTIPEKKIIKIGLLIPDKESVSAKNGAELAVLKANENKGIHDPEFLLVVRTMDGAWGAGGNEAVKLIFEDNVSAMVCSHDGRNAHLAEQAATKSEVVLLSAWSGDPTLSQAFVPWFFNCVPNYTLQADILVEEICQTRKIGRLTAIVDNAYDSKSAVTCFEKKIEETGSSLSKQIIFNGSHAELQELAGHLQKTKTEGIILFTRSNIAIKIINFLRKNNLSLPIFAPLFVLNENEIPGKDYRPFEKVVMISSEHWFSFKALTFRDEFREKYGYLPGNVAAFAYDGMQVLIAAIKKSGTGREEIQKALSEISFQGITGDFHFDNKGNRTGHVALVKIKNGNPVQVK